MYVTEAEAERACADAVIYNEGISPAELRQQVLTLAQRWTRRL